MSLKLKEKTIQKRDFLTLLDYSQQEILDLIEDAFKLEENPLQPVLQGKTLAMILKNRQQELVCHLKQECFN